MKKILSLFIVVLMVLSLSVAMFSCKKTDTATTTTTEVTTDASSDASADASN